MIILNDQLSAHIEKHANSTDDCDLPPGESKFKIHLPNQAMFKGSFNALSPLLSRILLEILNILKNAEKIVKYPCYLYTFWNLLSISSFSLGLFLFLFTIGCWVSRSANSLETFIYKQVQDDGDIYLQKKLQAILGASHAPPIDTFSHKRPLTNHSLNNKILEMAEAQYELLKIVDIAIFRLRILCSQQLGLGSYSPSLERIEGSSSDALNNGLSVTTNAAKRVLYDCLKIHYNALRSIIQQMPSKDNSFIEFYVSIQEFYEVDLNVVTISALKKCRRLNATFLSKVLSIVSRDFVTSNDLSDIFLVVEMNISCSEELEEYIRNYFHFYAQSKSTSNIKVQQLDDFQKLLYGIQVAIWSYTHNIMQMESQNRSRDDTGKELFRSITNMLEDMHTQHSLLSQLLYPEYHESNEYHSDETCVKEDIIEISNSANEIYDNVGDYDQPNFQQKKKSSQEIKTIIFSGKGLKTMNRNRFNSEIDRNDSTEMTFFRERIKVLSELKSRLMLLELCEEIESTNDGKMSNEFIQKSIMTDVSSKSDEFRTRYPPDAFLSDLLGAISNVCPTSTN